VCLVEQSPSEQHFVVADSRREFFSVKAHIADPNSSTTHQILSNSKPDSIEHTRSSVNVQDKVTESLKDIDEMLEYMDDQLDRLKTICFYLLYRLVVLQFLFSPQRLYATVLHVVAVDYL